MNITSTSVLTHMQYTDMKMDSCMQIRIGETGGSKTAELSIDFFTLLHKM